MNESEFNNLRKENKLILIPKYCMRFSNCYEYGDDIVLENITRISKQYWIVYDKEKFFRDAEKAACHMSEAFEKRFNKYLQDSATLAFYWKPLLDELWTRLKMDKTHLHYETITFEQLPIMDQQIRRYGLEKAYEDLGLHLAVFACECASRYHPGGHWKVKQVRNAKHGDTEGRLSYVTAWGDEVETMAFVIKSLIKHKRIYMQAQVLLLTKKAFNVVSGIK